MANDISEIIKIYCDSVYNDMNSRIDGWTVGLSQYQVREVVAGLMARQVTLSIQMAENPGIWNPHIAPIIQRCMADVFINFKWILCDPEKRSAQFIEYGLGQEKLAIEKYEDQVNNQEASGEKIPQEVRDLIKLRIQLLEERKYRFLTPVNVGNWASLDTRKMAVEIGEKAFYDFVYVQFSSAVHSTWAHVSGLNLAPCANPIHGGHMVPICPIIDSDFNEMLTSAKYLCKVFRAFDEKYPQSHQIDPYRSYDLVEKWLYDHKGSFGFQSEEAS